ncbi:MAG: c-type cytochrome [Myxococcales bacterium]|nr:c-type cytochrome [Myxococcales bacterium]
MAEHHDNDYDVHAHVTPTKVYVGVLAVLIFFTFLTVAAYNIRLGDWNLPVAILIATLKATLVISYFMHMKYETGFNIAFFLGTVAVVGIFLLYSMSDTETRAEVSEYSAGRYDSRTGEFASGTAPGIVEAGGEEAAIDPAVLAALAAESGEELGGGEAGGEQAGGEQAGAAGGQVERIPGDAEAGAAIYQRSCIACHAANGTGNGGMTGADFVNDASRLSKSDADLLTSIRDGIIGRGAPMPPQGGNLSEEEMRDVLSYIRREFGGE